MCWGLIAININFLGFKISITSKINKIEQRIDVIDEAVDDHLQSINENTNEIQANYENICELESKMEKLTQRMEEMQMLLKESVKTTHTFDDFSNIIPLNRVEQQAFFALYTDDVLTFSELAVKLSATEQIARRVIASMIRKGIPMQRELKGAVPAVSIEQKFKELQAKENIIGLDSAIVEVRN